MIDGGKKDIADTLSMIVNRIAVKQNDYLTRRAEAIRKAAEAEAARQALEAQEAARAAEETGNQQDIDAAVEAFGKADAAAALATAPTAEIGKVRTAGGALITQRDNWVYRVVDLSLVPTAYLSISDAMVKASIKGAGKNVAALKIPGLEIYNEPKTYTR
jgi:predicted lipid-binding transport protein (Tim44 family)